MSGWDAIASRDASAKRSRSTASAAPAGTRDAVGRAHDQRARAAASPPSAGRRRCRACRRERSCCRRARRGRSVLCTAVGRTGRISWSMTGTPSDAACQAASHPARPPPTMWTTHQGRATGRGVEVRDEARSETACITPPPSTSRLPSAFAVTPAPALHCARSRTPRCCRAAGARAAW